jgi:hypothetical protein
MRKIWFPVISPVLLTVFLAVLAAETTHHHGKLEDNDNCSVCAWQMTGSQAVAAPAPPVLLPVMLISTLFFFFSCLQYFHLVQTRGRSPPLLPL